MKRLLIPIFLIFTYAKGFSYTFRTIDNGFWSAAEVWEDGNLGSTANYGDTIIIDNLIRVDEDINLNEVVMIVTENGVLCSSYYSLYLENSVVINHGQVALVYITIGGGSEFTNNGLIRSEQVVESHVKKEPDGVLYNNGTLVIDPLVDACPLEVDPEEPDTLTNNLIYIEDDTVEICSGTSPEFPYAEARYIWEDGAINSDFTPNKEGLYHVEIVSKIDGSTSNDSVYILLIPSAYQIPNIFTPNDDQINDEFLVEGLSILEIQLYNRWGKQVANSETVEIDYNNISDGIYYYTLSHNNKCIELNPIKGWVQITR